MSEPLNLSRAYLSSDRFRAACRKRKAGFDGTFPVAIPPFQPTATA
jgi:hypothetical protein